MTAETAFAWAMRRFPKSGALAQLDDGTRARVIALVASGHGLERPAAVDRIAARAGSGREQAGALLASAPPHWRPLLRSLLQGRSGSPLAASLIAERLELLEEAQRSAPAVELTSERARVLGLRACGAVLGEFDRRAFFRFARTLPDPDRAAFDRGRGADLSGEGLRVLRDAWARLSSEAARDEAIVQLGTYLVAFALADDPEALRIARIAPPLRASFDDFARTTRHSTRRATADELRALVEGDS